MKAYVSLVQCLYRKCKSSSLLPILNHPIKNPCLSIQAAYALDISIVTGRLTYEPRGPSPGAPAKQGPQMLPSTACTLPREAWGGMCPHIFVHGMDAGCSPLCCLCPKGKLSLTLLGRQGVWGPQGKGSRAEVPDPTVASPSCPTQQGGPFPLWSPCWGVGGPPVFCLPGAPINIYLPLNIVSQLYFSFFALTSGKGLTR